jgi:hypothetical protein
MSEPLQNTTMSEPLQNTTLSKPLQNQISKSYKVAKSLLVTQIYDGSLSWLGSGTSNKCGGVELVLWGETSTLPEMMRSCTYFPHVGECQRSTNIHFNEVIICPGRIRIRYEKVMLQVQNWLFVT